MIGEQLSLIHISAHGIYLSKDAWVDAMYLLHLSCPQVVFSHETALFFHDLTDREPVSYTHLNFNNWTS